jgi:hypothetical protein
MQRDRLHPDREVCSLNSGAEQGKGRVVTQYIKDTVVRLRAPPQIVVSGGIKYPDIITLDETEARKAMSEAADLIERLAEALERVMIGGNHVALLIGMPHPPATATHEEAREHYRTRLESYEAWCCWKTIMEARRALSGKPT